MPPRGSLLLPVDMTVVFVVGIEITASVVISRVAREEWKSERVYIGCLRDQHCREVTNMKENARDA